MLSVSHMPRKGLKLHHFTVLCVVCCVLCVALHEYGYKFKDRVIRPLFTFNLNSDESSSYLPLPRTPFNFTRPACQYQNCSATCQNNMQTENYMSDKEDVPTSLHLFDFHKSPTKLHCTTVRTIHGTVRG